MMTFGGDKPNEPYGPIGPQGFPVQPPQGQMGPGYSPGSIRNTLGSGLKASGFFQKDGQIQNSRGGFFGPKQGPSQGVPYQAPPQSPGSGGFYGQQGGGYPPGGYNPNMGYSQGQGYNPGSGFNMGGGFPQGPNGMMPGQAPQPRQLILQAAQQGIAGNGVATISPDNQFLLVANLPPPHTFLGQGQAGTYAAYLVDSKGKTGFLVGVLRPLGNGVYRAHFQSPVPLQHYSRVVVSVENLAQLGQAPNGPIILKVKEPMGAMTFLAPMRNAASSVWGKISGLISGKKTPPVSPEAAPISPELLQSLNQMGVAPENMQGIPQMPPSGMAQMPQIPPLGMPPVGPN